MNLVPGLSRLNHCQNDSLHKHSYRMKVSVRPYDPEWRVQYEALKTRISSLLSPIQPVIEHIGSTSVQGLAAKPIIDIAVGVASLYDLEKTVTPMTEDGFLYYAAFNQDMPERRLFVGLRMDADRTGIPPIFHTLDEIPHDRLNLLRKCHIHIWVAGAPDWVRHLAFRDYLRAHPEVCDEYAKLKFNLSDREWEHGMAYNEAKEAFILHHQEIALKWSREIKVT